MKENKLKKLRKSNKLKISMMIILGTWDAVILTLDGGFICPFVVIMIGPTSTD